MRSNEVEYILTETGDDISSSLLQWTRTSGNISEFVGSLPLYFLLKTSNLMQIIFDAHDVDILVSYF